MPIIVTVTLETLPRLINHLKRDVCSDEQAYLPEGDGVLFKTIQDYLESVLIADYYDLEVAGNYNEDIDFVNAVADELVGKINAFLDTCNLIGILPYSHKGNVVVVMTLKDED